MGRAVLLGAVFGETGLPDGFFHDMIGDEIASSPYYMVGWIGFSCLPAVGGIADIRDAVQAIINGDAVGAAMNAAGALPGPGDGVKVTGAVACFTGKYPWKARELGVLLSKEIMPHLPDSIKIDVWNVLYDGAGSALHSTHGVPVEAMEKLAQKGIDLAHVREFLEATYEGGWAPTKKLTASGNLDKHYNHHVLDQFEWGETFTKSVYLEKATTLANRRDGNVELYYQEGYDTLVVYDRSVNEFVSGTKDGLFTTFFKPDNNQKHYVDQQIAYRLIRLN